MKFIYQKTIHLNTDVANVWNAITHPDFERDFLPEIRRSQSSVTQPIESINEKSLRWCTTDDTNIELTRKDLIVAISAIEISLAPLSNGVAVTMRVDYKKRFESKFVKAHMAVRSLFTQKLRVLKEDVVQVEREFAFW